MAAEQNTPTKRPTQTRIRHPSRATLMKGCHAQKIVTIKIGPDATPYMIHQDLICQFSPFFKNAFTGNFKEAEVRSIHLADVAPRVFDLFVGWLYTATLELNADATPHSDASAVFACSCPIPSGFNTSSNTVQRSGKWAKSPLAAKIDQRPLTKEARCHPVSSTEMDLIHLAIFVDLYTIDRLQNDIIDTLHGAFKRCAWLPALCILSLARSQLQPGSHVLKYLAFRHLTFVDPLVNLSCLVTHDRKPHMDITDLLDGRAMVHWSSLLRLDWIHMNLENSNTAPHYPALRKIMDGDITEDFCSTFHVKIAGLCVSCLPAGG